MIFNYLKVAIRSILRNKLTSFINIAGLALAMGCAVMIYFYVIDETSYDQYNLKADRIYRIGRDFLSADGTANLRLSSVAPPAGPLIRTDFGEVEVMARTLQNGMVIGLEGNGELKKSINENKVFLTEPDIFKIFDFKIVAGNPEHALDRPFTIMLSEETAHKYFGNENPVGKRLRGSNKYDFEVTGVFEKLPPQAHWHPELLVSFSTLEDSTIYGRKGLESNWGNNSFQTYVLLREGVSPQKLEAQFPDFLNRHFGPYAIQNFGAPANFIASKVTRLTLTKVTDVHLRSHRDDEIEANGNINNVYMIGVIGIFIVLIACFNFVNLSTAQATKRAKEVGLRKVVGAFRNQLIGQYLSESVLMTLFGLVLASGLVAACLGWLNNFTGKQIVFNPVQHWPVAAGMIVFALVVGLLAGIYPAFIISGFKPALVLKGEQGSAGGKGGIRKILVVAQFAISVGLIIATAITSEQLKFLTSQNLGYEKDQVITLPYLDEMTPTYPAFYNELTKNALVKNAARSSRVPTGRLLDDYGGLRVRKNDSLIAANVTLKSISVDDEFFDAYGIKFVAGRSFSKSIRTDDSLGFIINEAAAAKIGWTDFASQIGQDFGYAGVNGKLIGVAQNFHFESLHQSIVPMVFLVRKNNFNALSVKLSGNTQEGLAYVEKVWKEFQPNQPFEFQFVSEKYNQLYQSEQQQSQLFSIFSGVAIFIACLGLFGLATFNTLLRIKEIGIRKVLGATVPSIVRLLSAEIIILVLLANVIAWPVVWLLMGKWLGTFAYHIDMNPVIYILAGIVAVIVALLTVSVQTVKAAVTNPTQTLRRE